MPTGWEADSEQRVALNPVLAVTVGDPRGIGPEIVVPAVSRVRSESPGLRCAVLGPEAPALAEALGVDASYDAVGRFDGSAESAGRVSALAVERAVQMCLAGDAQGVVTGPVHKPSLHAAGWKVPGQTKMLQRLGSAPIVGMLMCAESTPRGKPLRVLLATTHLPLRQVAARLTAELLVAQTVLLERELRTAWRIERPRIALCALNPHASDGGLFGDEEVRVYGPALETLSGQGLLVEGPFPADTVFVRALGGAFDAVVAPYHDVGMAAFKTAAFGGGVNVTLGLPFVRTSPDHGTAFDIAGTGAADPSSMAEAIRLAAVLARHRFDDPGRRE